MTLLRPTEARPTDVAHSLIAACGDDTAKARLAALEFKHLAADAISSAKRGSDAECKALAWHKYWVTVTLRVDRIAKLNAARAARVLA